MAKSSPQIGAIASLAVTLLIAVVAGARDAALAAVTLILYVPVTFVLGVLVHTLFGFRLEASPAGVNARLGDYDNDE